MVWALCKRTGHVSFQLYMKMGYCEIYNFLSYYLEKNEFKLFASGYKLNWKCQFGLTKHKNKLGLKKHVIKCAFSILLFHWIITLLLLFLIL